MLTPVAVALVVASGFGGFNAGMPDTDTWWVTPQAHAFPDTQVGDTSSITVTIMNVGAVPATPFITRSGTDDAKHFDAARTCRSTPVPPGGSCRISYRFRPSAVTSYTTTVDLVVDGIRHPIAFTGRGLFPLVFSATTVAFGGSPVGVTTEADIDLTNVSRVPQPLGEMAGGAPRDRDDFSARLCPSSSLPPGASCRLEYSFHPTRVGILSTTTTLETDGVSTVLSFSGRGTAAVTATHSGSTSIGLTPDLMPLGAGGVSGYSSPDPSTQPVAYASPATQRPAAPSALENPIELAMVLGVALTAWLLLRRRHATGGPPAAG